jgi:hypothetical protein
MHARFPPCGDTAGEEKRQARALFVHRRAR